MKLGYGIIAATFAIAVFASAPVTAARHATNVPMGARLLAHTSGTSSSPNGNNGNWSVNVYRIAQATAPPKGAAVYNVRKEIAQENAFNRTPVSQRVIRPDSGCTRGCGFWQFTCPGTYFEAIKWDEQDGFNTPLYHQEMDVEAGVDCKHAWTIWRNADHCATYGLGWGCVSPIPQGRFWDGSWEQNWSNTTFHFQAPIPLLCENDLLALRLRTGPGGGVWGQAYPPVISDC